MTEIVVTEHALRRYMEQIGAPDLETARKEIAELARPGVARGYHYYEVDDLSLRLERNTVITIIWRGDRHLLQKDAR